MKKIITLFSIMAFLIFGANAQLSRTNPEIFKVKVPVKDQIKNGTERANLPKGSYLKSVAADPNYGDTVGYTWYDLQTNAGMQLRIYEDDNGNIQTIWTKALDTITDPTVASRGVGYNYYDASSMTWNPGDSNNVFFGIAEKRVGWPSLAPISGGGEAVFAHTNRLYTNPSKGATNWSAVDLSTSLPGGNLFYHSAAEGNSIYVTYDNGEGGLFARSDDNGATWPISDFAYDSAGGYVLRPISADGIDMDTKGDTVALVTGGNAAYTGVEPNDVVLYLSTDRGATWTHQVIHVFDTINAELDSASGGYIVLTPHADVRVLIGSDGRIHCGGSVMGALTDPGALTSGSWFPLVRGIWYWNSDMPTGFDINDPVDYDTYVLVDSIPDMSTMGSYPAASADQGNYVAGSFTHANLSEDAAGNLYIVFDGVCAGSDNNPFDGRWRRDLYAMKSGDGGMNWSDAKNLGLISGQNDLTDGTVGEEAYCVTPKRVRNDILVFFQYDSWAGPTLVDDIPILEENKMVVYRLDPNAISGIDNDIAKESLSIYPNPAKSFASVNFESRRAGETVVTVSNLIGQTVKSINADILNGNNSVILDLNDLNKGIYLVSIGTGANKITQKLVID